MDYQRPYHLNVTDDHVTVSLSFTLKIGVDEQVHDAQVARLKTMTKDYLANLGAEILDDHMNVIKNDTYCGSKREKLLADARS